MSKSNLSRRQFLNRSVAMAGAGLAIGGTRSTGRVNGRMIPSGSQWRGSTAAANLMSTSTWRCPGWPYWPDPTARHSSCPSEWLDHNPWASLIPLAAGASRS